MSHSNEQLIEICGTIEDIPLYSDPEIDELTRTFDPSTYVTSYDSGYRDGSIELALFPFPQVAKQIGRYVGFDDPGLEAIRSILMGWGKTRFSFGGVPIERFTRVADFEGNRIFFPTQQMLENFGISRF